MIYENIKKICDKKSITIKDLEISTELPNGIVGKWKRSDPRLSSVVKVARFLDVSIDSLVEGSTD